MKEGRNQKREEARHGGITAPSQHKDPTFQKGPGEHQRKKLWGRRNTKKKCRLLSR